MAALTAFAAFNSASAADLGRPIYKAPAYVPAYFSWTGFYVGINGGYGWGTSNWSGGGITTGDFTVKGGLLGGTAGYNYQVGSFVAGLEADLDYSWIKGSTPTTCAPGLCETRNTWLGTGRGRLGYAFDRFLPFITGGVAVGNVKETFLGASESQTKTGYALGGGLEYAFLSNWSVKAEYLYVDLGKASCSAATCGVPSDVKFKSNILRAGLNYRF
jgi:outer membrane immunogenic protein